MAFQWEFEFIRAIQAVGGDFGIWLAEMFTMLGNQEFYLLLFPFLFWCLDRQTGARITLLYLLSIFLNIGLKELISQPRPYELDASLALVDPGEVYGGGHGMPSGHAQWSMTVWAAMALWVQTPLFWALALLMTFLVGFSRVYLGVHFPTQVLAGWGIGVLVVAVYAMTVDNIETAVTQWRLEAQLGLAVLLPLALLWLLPTADNMAAMSVLAGTGVGLVMAGRLVTAVLSDSWGKRGASYLIGIVVMLAIYLGLSALFPGEGETFYVPLRILRYALLGLWISWGAPWLFVRLQLSTAIIQARTG